MRYQNAAAVGDAPELAVPVREVFAWNAADRLIVDGPSGRHAKLGHDEICRAEPRIEERRGGQIEVCDPHTGRDGEPSERAPGILREDRCDAAGSALTEEADQPR